MQTHLVRRFSIALLCAAGLLAAACNRAGTQPQAGQAAPGSPATTQQAQNAPGQPDGQNPAAQPAGSQGNELRPGPQSFSVPPPAGAAPGAQDLAPRARQYMEGQPGATPEPQAQASPSQQAQALPPQQAAVAPGPYAPGRSAAYPRRPLPDQAGLVPVAVPAGTHFAVELGTRLGSDSSWPGERFRARIVSPVSVQGMVAIPSGSEVVGVVTEAQSPRRLGGRAVLGLRFTDLVLPSGATVPIRASFVEAGSSRTGRNAAIIGGSAVGGAVIGHHVSGNRSGGTIVGGLLGAALGTAIAAHHPGHPIVLPRGSVVRLRLNQPVELEVPESYARVSPPRYPRLRNGG
jgi:hypothetical protein